MSHPVVFGYALLFAFISFSIGGSVSIENSKVYFEFSDDSGSITSLIDKTTENEFNLIESNTEKYSIWDVTFVDSFGPVHIENIGNTVDYKLDKAFNIQTLTMTWKSLSIVSTAADDKSVVDVVLVVTLIDDAPAAYWNIGVNVVNGTSIGVWEARLSLPLTVGNDVNGELFFPSGFGTLYSDPIQNAGGGVSSTYPGSGATMQFMALGSHATTVSSAGYMAALDGKGSPKLLQYSTNSRADLSAVKKPNEVNGVIGARPGEVQSFPLATGPVRPDLSFLSVTIYPEDAGVAIAPGSKWTSTYMVAVGVVSGVSTSAGRPLWYEAAALYRDWALKDAQWTKKGPFSARDQPALPSWYRSNTIWLNTHWQCHDIFNETGGDPAFVAENTKLLADALGQSSIALHWYEFQQGPNPTPEARYKFDTHYPDYFPPRNAFEDAVMDLQEHSGVHTVPYINGRIFDVASDSYLADDGHQYCAKYLQDVKMIADKNNVEASSPLVSYVETYGSDASFCVANPYAAYWQNKVADTVDELVNKWGVDGVYIDQIGSAGPKMCWDGQHGHTLGGGGWWREGYVQMLDKINEKILTSDGVASAPIVTEDNAEPYMDSLQGYLTLVAFKCSLQQQATASTSGYKQLAPAFPAVYGGYYVGFGAQWYQLDFEDHDWWRGKLAATFVTGTQMGWFSIAGVNDDPDDSCGNMAVGDFLLNADNSDLVEYLQLLASYRRALTDYVVDGRLARPGVLEPAPPMLTQKVASGGYPLFDYDSVATASWELSSDSSSRVASIFASVTAQKFESDLTVDFRNWGFDHVDMLTVSSVSATGERTRLFDIKGPVATMSVQVPPLDVLVLEFAPAVKSSHYE